MSYCSTLKTWQVENVLEKEANLADQGGDKSLYYEAREELRGRGVDPDEVLRERGIRKP
jgi:hypothetical protein